MKRTNETEQAIRDAACFLRRPSHSKAEHLIDYVKGTNETERAIRDAAGKNQGQTIERTNEDTNGSERTNARTREQTHERTDPKNIIALWRLHVYTRKNEKNVIKE